MTTGRIAALTIAVVFLLAFFVANDYAWYFVSELLKSLNKQSDGRLFGLNPQLVILSMFVAKMVGRASSLFGILSMALIACQIRWGLLLGYVAALCNGFAMCATLSLWPCAQEVVAGAILDWPYIIPTIFISSLATQLVTLLLMAWSLREAKTLLNDLEDRRRANVDPKYLA